MMSPESTTDMFMFPMIRTKVRVHLIFEHHINIWMKYVDLRAFSNYLVKPFIEVKGWILNFVSAARCDLKSLKFDVKLFLRGNQIWVFHNLVFQIGSPKIGLIRFEKNLIFVTLPFLYERIWMKTLNESTVICQIEIFL